MEKEENVVLTLVDENDEEFEAELIDSIMYDGHVYNFFVPVADKESDEAPVIVMEYKEEGEDIVLTPVENEVLLDEIWDAYMEETEEIEQEEK